MASYSIYALREYSTSFSLSGSLIGKACCKCSRALPIDARTSSTLRLVMSAISSTGEAFEGVQDEGLRLVAAGIAQGCLD